MKALIVDDSVTARMMVQKILTDLGFDQIVTANNGREGLTTAEQNLDLSLITVDWNMPEMDGLELVKALRANAQLDQAKILMVTTETGMQKMSEALLAGAEEYVMKPFTREILQDKLTILGLEIPSGV